MKTVVVGPRPPELDDVIARRHALGQDRYDEVWDGDYHMAPAPHQWHGYLVSQLLDAFREPADRAGLVRLDAFNLGTADDYRVPDIGLLRALGAGSFVPAAALVVEVVSPADESWDKFDFYASRGVDEVLIADPTMRTLALFQLDRGGYGAVERSAVLGVTVAELDAALRWPG